MHLSAGEPGARLADLSVEVLSADARARAGCMRARGVRLRAPAVRLAVQGQEDGLVRDALPLGLRVLPQLGRVLQGAPLLSLFQSSTPLQMILACNTDKYVPDEPDTGQPSRKCWGDVA